MVHLKIVSSTNTIDDNVNIVRLGEWVVEHGNNANMTTHKYPLDSINKINIAANYCNNIYKKLLPIISDRLNIIHNKSNDVRYWEILIGNWLITFIHVVYDRYITIKSFSSSHKEFDTLLLHPSSYVAPFDHNEFSKMVDEDVYNLQLFSEIFIGLGYTFKSEQENFHPMERKITFGRNASIKKTLFRFLNFFSVRPYIVFTNLGGQPGFSGVLQNFRLLVALRFRACFDDFDDYVEINANVSNELRKKLSHFNINFGGAFVNILIGMLKNNMPTVFLENYEQIKSIVLSRRGISDVNRCNISATSEGLLINTLYKFWLAENKNIIKVAVFQHGGGYGLDTICTPEQYEKNISDIFFSWGWKDSSKVEALTPLRLLKKFNFSHNGYVLYVLTATPSYLIRLQNGQTSSSFKLSYIPNAVAFIGALSSIDNLLTRPYRDRNNKFEISKVISSNFPEVKFDKCGNSFQKCIEKSKLVVVDHMHTSHLELLANNIPTIIFIDSKFYSFRDAPSITVLKDACILFDNPIDAAEHINKINSNVGAWWNSPITQSARLLFCEKYARVLKNWGTEWRHKFSEML